MRQVLNETAENHLANQSKIENWMDLMFVDDMEQLAFDDREKTRQYEAAKFGWRSPSQELRPARAANGKRKARDEMGHILGDVQVEHPERVSMAGVLVPLAALAVAGALAWRALEPTPAPGVGPNTDTITDVTAGFGDPSPIADRLDD